MFGSTSWPQIGFNVFLMAKFFSQGHPVNCFYYFKFEVLSKTNYDFNLKFSVSPEFKFQILLKLFDIVWTVNCLCT